MDTQDVSKTPEITPVSSPSTDVPAILTSSIVSPLHLAAPNNTFNSPTSSSHGYLEFSTFADDFQAGQDLTPWELEACQRLTTQIRGTSASKRDVEISSSGSSHIHSLEEVLRKTATTIRFNAKWFAEDDLAILLDVALDSASSSSASVDLYAAVALVDVIGTYSYIPLKSLSRVTGFITQTYYSATRAHKTKKLADATWTTLQRILESHLGDQCMEALVELIECQDEAHLETKAGYAQIAGALMIISDKLLLNENSQQALPSPYLNALLQSMTTASVNGSDNLREFILETVSVILADGTCISELDAQSSWDALLESIRSAVTRTPGSKAAQSSIEGLILRLDHFEHRQLSTIAWLAIEVDLPLTKPLSEVVATRWQDTLQDSSMPEDLVDRLALLCRSSQYVQQLKSLVRKTFVEPLSWSSEQACTPDLIGRLQDLALNVATTVECSAVLTNALIALFKQSSCSHASNSTTILLFESLCTLARHSIEAARMLFRIRADVEGTLYIEMEQQSSGSDFDNRVPSEETFLHDIRSLPVQKWLDMIFTVLDGSTEWEVRHYYITALTALLGNHAMFKERIDFIKRLRTVLCKLLNSGEYLEPPSSTGMTKSHATMALVQTLAAALSYHRLLSKHEILDAVSIFLNMAGSRDYIISTPCVHALTICCYEFPDLMSSYMDDIIDKLSKMVTQRYLAIHVLLFLAGLSRQPALFRNFQTHDYKKVFGVCGSYLQSTRGSNLLLERQQTPSSDQSSKKSLETSDALPQYVYALAHHVIAFWYLALQTHDRHELKEYITTCLKYADAEGHEVMEDQGLVTIDLMDCADVEDGRGKVTVAFDESEGSVMTIHRLSGLLLISTSTALRSGKTIVTVRRATGTVKWVLNASPDSLEAARTVVVSLEGGPDAHLRVFPEDVDGRTYGTIYTPRSDSVIGSETNLTLTDDDMVTRAIQSFDRTSALDSHKAGVIYIGEDQSTEDEILLNAMGSPDYVEFVHNLGALTRLKGATFNTQGLDRIDNGDGHHCVVWHNNLTELVFHITTYMPNSDDISLNTANKKRHIGNDHVNIVFNNSGNPFDFNTFPSQFNSVYVVISPSARTSFLQTRAQDTTTDHTKERFYTVQVLTRPGYPSISSAAESKVVSGSSLPSYVRNLALNECIFSLMWEHKADPGEYPSSWRSRLEQIRRLRQRYQTS